MFPPHFSSVIDDKLGVTQAHQCIYCEMGINEITMEKQPGVTVKYTRAECLKDYDIFLKKVKEEQNKRNAAKILVTGGKEQNAKGNIIKR
jgi:hypothetical protein